MSDSIYVPKGFSETADFFVVVMLGAPEFTLDDGLTLDQAFRDLEVGIDSVIAKAKKSDAVALLERCKAELASVREMFLANPEGDPEKRKAARTRLQRAYYELYRKAGEMLKPGVDIGPDDDV